MSILSNIQTNITDIHNTKSFLVNNFKQSYIPITGCVLSHILSCSRLSSLEKMYYILADSISCINSSKGRNRSVSLPAKSWAERLACSKSEVFILQKSLEDKGYFIIYRDKNDKGQNNRNTITTTIPDHVFSDLQYEPDRFNLNYDSEIDDKTTEHSLSDTLDSIDKTFIPTLEGKRQHLEKTKMFIRLPYQFLKELNSNCSISATSKVVLLYLFTKIYKSSVSKYNHDCSDSRYDYDNAVGYLTHNSNPIVTSSYQELHIELKLHRNSLTKALKTLEEANLIKKDQIVIKSDDDYNSRADKSLWRISLVNTSLITNDSNLHEPKWKEDQQDQIDKQQIEQSTTNIVINTYDHEDDIGVNQALESSAEKGCTKYAPPCTDSGQLYIKNFILKNSINNNIDYIDVKSEESSISCSSFKLTSEQNYKEEFLENEQSSFPSESYNNSSFLNNPCNKPQLRQTVKQEETITKSTNKAVLEQEAQQKDKLQNKPEEEWKELRSFYPLSEKDISLLNLRANREFSNNFVNQLLLKLYIKYPEKRFKNRFIFLSYMVQILKNEKHQGPLVNHTSFRFSCNIGTEEKNLLEYERYLNQIENSLDTSKEMNLKKKIAGRFNTEVAYKILTKVQFKTNHDNSLITALIPNYLDLSERATLSEQIEAVYGVNRYYVQELEGDAIQPPKSKTTDIDFNEKSIWILELSKASEAITENTVWHQIRKGLREELGDHADQAWFAKAVAVECTETSTLTLTMPTRFMADWIKNNYSYVIRRIASGLGINRVGYGYEQNNRV